MSRQDVIQTFDFSPGRVLARKYEVLSLLGSGYEGEVYKVRELNTGIDRAAKFFFPHRNEGNRAFNTYARKLNKLRHCPILVQYHTHETITFRRQPLRFLVSEYVEGELLSEYLARQPAKRLSMFEGLHLLYALAAGMETIHQMGEYHGDLHSDNVVVHRKGIWFEVRLLDMYHRGRTTAEKIQDDVVDLLRLYVEIIGGKRYYAKLPPEVKEICRGLKRPLIIQQFRNAGQLRRHLATMTWDS